MKKSMQFLFAMCILLEGQSSFAGTNSEMPVVEKNTPASSMVNPKLIPQYLIVTVTDDAMKPIQGAAVHAPCTGITDPAYTNSSGVAQFTWTGTCNCTGAQAEITTPDCDQYITLKCNVNNQAICKP